MPASADHNDSRSLADRLIEAAIDAGEFEDLPGEGEPLSGAGRVDDDDWWVRAWVRRNRSPDGPSRDR